MISLKRWARTLAAIVSCLVLTACGGDDDEPASTTEITPTSEDTATTNQTTSEATTTTLAPGDAAVAAYLSYLDAIHAAVAVPDPDLAALDEYATAAASERDRNTVRQVAEQGLRAEVSKANDVTVVSTDDSSAVLRNCLTETVTYFDLESDEQQGNPSRSEAHVEIGMVLEDDGWKVDSLTTLEEPCD